VASTKGNVRQQYFLVYGVEGSLGPFLSVVLASHLGLSPDDIGTVVAVGGLAILVTPLLLGALADTGLRETRLLGGILVVAAAALLLMMAITGFWPTLLLYALFSLAYEPAKSLQDGLFFAARRTDADLARASFNQIRVWGTIGFLVPGIVLWASLGRGAGIGVVLVVAAVMAAISAINTLRLPQPPAAASSARLAAIRGLGVSLSAATAVVRGARVAVFATPMLLVQVAMSVYYLFYPLYVNTTVGIDARWLGLIANLGVGLEVVYMALYGWLLARLGWRRFMVGAAMAQGVRLLALALWPTVFAALATQTVHGFVVIATLVAGRVFFDGEADDRIRHAMQGLYTLLVIGGGRFVGSFLGGLVGAYDLQLLFRLAAILCLVATGLLAWTFRKGTAP
jgi:PPP family 3-phenylpropionic acid transporter